MNDLLDKRVRQKETKQAGGGCSYHFCSRRPFSCSGPAARCAQRHPRVLFQGQHQPQNSRRPDLDWNPKHMRDKLILPLIKGGGVGLASRFCCCFSSKWKGKARTIPKGALLRLHNLGFHLAGNMLKINGFPLEK